MDEKQNCPNKYPGQEVLHPSASMYPQMNANPMNTPRPNYSAATSNYLQNA